MADDEVGAPGTPDGLGKRLDTGEKASVEFWFKAIVERLQGFAEACACSSGAQGADVETIASDVITDLAKRLAKRRVAIDQNADWAALKREIRVSVRHRLINTVRHKRRKPGDVGRGAFDAGEVNPVEVASAPSDSPTFSPTNAEEHVPTGIGSMVGLVKEEAGLQAWKTFVDVKVRELSAREVQEKYGYTTPGEVYRIVEKVTRLLKKYRQAKDGR
jgi:hypothetical protein